MPCQQIYERWKNNDKKKTLSALVGVQRRTPLTLDRNICCVYTQRLRTLYDSF